MRLSALLSAGLVLATATALFAQEGGGKAPGAGALNSPKDRASYGIGRNIGEQLKGAGLDLDVNVLFRGLTEALSGVKSSQTDEEFQEAIAALEKQTQADAAAKAKTFLDTNGKQQGVTTTKSGLQYQVLKDSKGKKPLATDSVKAHYKGTFLDGKTFDSSYDRGEPAVFPLNGVIRGWTEGVPLMSVGSKFKFWIPSELAYGPRGRPGIPANSTLVFEIELLDVIPGDGGADPAPAPTKK